MKTLTLESARKHSSNIVSKFGIYIIFLIIFMICSVQNKAFLSENNLLNVMRQISVYSMVAFAEMLLMIQGCLDLAASSTLALSGMLAVDVYLATESFVLAGIVAALSGALVNVISATLVTKLRIPSFLVGLAMSEIVRGAVLIYSDGIVVTMVGDFGKYGQGKFWGAIPYPVITMLIIAIVLSILLKYTRFGRNCYAMGGNEEAAKAAGIDVIKTRIVAYIFAGLIVGFAGFTMMSRINSGLPTAGEGYHTDAISGAVIGGASLSGGAGSVIGCLTGGVIIGIINNILNLNGISSYVQRVIKGAIIIVAVAIDMYTRKKKIQDI